MKITNKDMRAAVQEALDLGWEVTKAKNNHLRLQHPEHGVVFTSWSPSDHRTVKNFRAAIRRRMR